MNTLVAFVVLLIFSVFGLALIGLAQDKPPSRRIKKRGKG